MKNTAEKEKHYFSQMGLQTLKSDVDLVFAIRAETKLLRKGKRFFGRCPLHESNEPTLVISSQKNLWYCFGPCKKGGSLVDWVMHKEKLRFIEALAFLAEQYPFLAQKGQVGKMGLK